MEIAAMTEQHALDIVTWRYPEPYRCYDIVGTDPRYLTDPASGFVAIVDDRTLIGYRSFGADGRVPGGVYDECALDTGGGLRPQLTGLGSGLGRRVIALGSAYGQARYEPAAFRVTVASFNTRARHVTETLGFALQSTFAATADGRSFDVLVRPGDHGRDRGEGSTASSPGSSRENGELPARRVRNIARGADHGPASRAGGGAGQRG